MRPSFTIANMRHPEIGSKALPITLNFSSAVLIADDLLTEMESGEFDFVQSIFIDNKNNAAALDFTVLGMSSTQVIRAQPFSQGFYPISPAVGMFRYTAQTTLGQLVPIILYNIPLPYFVWGPGAGGPGTLVNPDLALAPAINGNNTLVAAVAGQSVKLYRLLLTTDIAVDLTLTDGAGGANLFGPVKLLGFGSFMLPMGALPWVTTTAGNALVLKTNAVATIGGGFGHVQS